jgi:hypothetical protein
MNTMQQTQYFKWEKDGSIIATLEVRHRLTQMLLTVVGSWTAVVGNKMADLNNDGMYPNEQSTNGLLYSQFIISEGYNWNCRWRDLITILNELFGVPGVEEDWYDDSPMIKPQHEDPEEAPPSTARLIWGQMSRNL